MVYSSPAFDAVERVDLGVGSAGYSVGRDDALGIILGAGGGTITITGAKTRSTLTAPLARRYSIMGVVAATVTDPLGGRFCSPTERLDPERFVTLII
jgi:hypothetical protein